MTGRKPLIPYAGVPCAQGLTSLTDVHDWGVKPGPLPPGSMKSVAQLTPELPVGSDCGSPALSPHLFHSFSFPLLSCTFLLRAPPPAPIGTGIPTSVSSSRERDPRQTHPFILSGHHTWLCMWSFTSESFLPCEVLWRAGFMSCPSLDFHQPPSTRPCSWDLLSACPTARGEISCVDVEGLGR